MGGGGILSGMSPKGYFDEEGAEALISSAKQYKAKPPGSAQIHYDETGFFRYVYDKETEVLDGLKEYMRDIPAYHPDFENRMRMEQVITEKVYPERFIHAAELALRDGGFSFTPRMSKAGEELGQRFADRFAPAGEGQLAALRQIPADQLYCCCSDLNRYDICLGFSDNVSDVFCR